MRRPRRHENLYPRTKASCETGLQHIVPQRREPLPYLRREWPGNRPRECQAKKPLRLVRSSLYEPGEVAKLIGVKGCG